MTPQLGPNHPAYGRDTTGLPPVKPVSEHKPRPGRPVRILPSGDPVLAVLEAEVERCQINRDLARCRLRMAQDALDAHRRARGVVVPEMPRVGAILLGYLAEHYLREDEDCRCWRCVAVRALVRTEQARRGSRR